MRIMYDAIYADRLPPGAGLYAGYVDGHWPDAAAIAERFPRALIVRIATSPTTNDGVIGDGPPDNGTWPEWVHWVVKRRAAGVDPTINTNLSNWEDGKAAFKAAGVAEPHWWIAHYDGDPTIPAGAIAKQYESNDFYDTSSVAAYWPGVDPAPTPVPTRIHELEDDDMYLITAPRTAAPTSLKDVFMLQGSEYVHVPDTAKYGQLVRLGGKIGEVDYDTHAWLLAQFHGTPVVG